MDSLGILGVGELTEKVVRGLRHAGYCGAIKLSPRNHHRAIALRDHFDCEVMPDNQAVVDHSALVILGIRPDDVAQLVQKVTIGPDKTLVSLVAGMNVNTLAQHFPNTTLVRAMLSYAAEINSTTVVTYPPNIRAQQLLSPLGTSILLEDENAFELATVAACMNGWFYFWLEGLQQWFTDNGMPAEQARQLVLSNMQDCLASARQKPGFSLEAIGQTIASPGTFTAKGLDVLQSQNADAPWSAACDAVLLGLKGKS
ncbi:pyrroline-5-carboxylate reductase family protein [Pseudomonas sp. EL_65y_Pfl2_R95]|uniref:pyrroline-5-carboxylate reductase family protein n=1 Tax=Pseudomonas sp. EL_65y_Pfl2_R95 TaxID=3088698 RepID=UPI0030DACC90